MAIIQNEFAAYRRKGYALVILIFFSVAAYTCLQIRHSYQVLINEKKAFSTSEMKAYAWALAQKIAVLDHEQLIVEHPQKDAIQNLYDDENYFQHWQVLSMLSNLSEWGGTAYTLFQEKAPPFRWLIGVKGEEKPAFRHIWKKPFAVSDISNLPASFQGEDAIYVFYPIESMKGDVVSYLVLEKAHSKIIAQVWPTFLEKAGIRLLALIIFALMLIPLSRHFLFFSFKLEATFKHAVGLKTAKYKEMNQALSSEITHRSDAIKELQQKLAKELKIIRDLSIEKATASSDEAIEDSFQQIIHASDYAIDLIQESEELEKIEADGFTLEACSFNIREVISSTILPFEHLAARQNLQFEFIYGPRIPKGIYGDPQRIRQILRLMIKHALHETTSGKVRVHFHNEGNENGMVWLKMIVTDTREPHAGMGQGVGDFLTQVLAENMHGSFGVQSPSEYPLSSRGGKGRDTWVMLPLKESVNIATEIDEFQEGILPMFSRSPKIMMVEDNVISQLVIRKQLEQMGAKVVTVSNGIKAYQILEEFPHFDLILMDLQLPRLDGIEATRLIRKKNRNHLPIIGTTASAFQRDVDACFEAGMNDFLPKPFSSQDLFEVINKWIELSFSVK